MATVKKVVKKAQTGVTEKDNKGIYTYTVKGNTSKGPRYYSAKSPVMGTAMNIANFKLRREGADSLRSESINPKIKKEMDQQKKGGVTKKPKAKTGKQMIKRADGSYSQRGLWDNIRAAKGSGKKPTAAMLKQEKKIKAKTK